MSNLELEVRWLKDPVKLADHTVKLLREDDFRKALEIVRLASKHMECTVSWNHLIDYKMSKAKVTDAVKLYNEMKKRAQLPDAYTFTILFRGFSWFPQFSQSTPRALSIYQSMFAENSPVRPSIIHTNAILKVCALAHDVDALIAIAAELPTRGRGAPNNLTFTTILNAIRSRAIGETDARRATSRGKDKKRNETTALAIQQGRRLWVEVRQRWMSGDLHLDEEFVCAMGRLLLLGSDAQDHDDVLSLLEQTMGIPRQVARSADPALGRAEEAAELENDPELPRRSPANVDFETLLSPSEKEDDCPEPPSDPFAPLSTVAGPTQSAVRPGHNTLSLVLDACIRLNYARAAQNYWGLLTSPDGYHKIVPDSDNYHMYLRLLRLQRSAKLAVELVDEMRSGELTGKAGAVQTKTFRIALSCCVRDSNNRNSILHAGKLVKMMTDTLPYPDAKALSMYLRVALSQKPRDWRVIMGVIRGTELGVRNLRSLLAYDPAGARKQNEEDILELVRGLIGAFDVVLDLGNEEIASEEKKRCREQRHTLAAYVTKTHIRLVAEGKIVEVTKGDGEGTDGRVTPSKKSRNGRKSDDHKAEKDGDNDDFEGDSDEVVARRPAEEVSHAGPGKGGWKREWRMRERVEK
ncbi:MAG: hypothetical protein ASARMPREDX12_008252 [Alectoria sarmentosa]|nr:MAG: hypothetical protein ASARMPREDX12_008252 [Alectoria sarmentosa]CAD6592838.1 MAG: hypothetical protein ASARMPRED_006746 [Alectoria sarmentosa]